MKRASLLLAAMISAYSPAATAPPTEGPLRPRTAQVASEQFLDVMVHEFSERGWAVQSNPPTYEITFTDRNGHVQYMRGIAFIKPQNPAMRYGLTKVDVNPTRREEEVQIRDNLPYPLNVETQLIYLRGANAISERDISTIEALILTGSLLEDPESTTTPIAPSTWAALKGLYRP